MRVRLLLWFLGFSLIILLVWVIWGGHWAQWADMNNVVAALHGYGISAGLAGALMLVLDLLLPIPGTVVISALGFIYGTWQGALIAFAGLFAAGMIGYGLGRLCSEKTAVKFLGDKDFQRGKSLFERGGGWVVALSRAVPILPEAISVSAGMLRMAVLFAWIGASGHERPWLTLVLSFAVPAVLWSAASLWRKKRTGV